MDSPNDGGDNGARKQKSGGGGGGSPATHGQFMGDEFRVYMSRKIELQRKQIGLVLPPPPPPQPAAADGDSSETTSTRTPSKSKRKRVRFSQTLSTSTPLSDDDEGGRGGGTDGGGDLSAVLSRLKERHGQGRKKKRKQKGVKSMPSPDLAAIEEKRNDISSPSSPKRRKGDKDDSRTQQNASGPSNVISTKRSRPDLFFYGVVVLINGYTSPDTPTLTRMLQKHGGDVEKYETSRVTHIIASALSTAKALIYKRQRNPTPYVYPQWVVDSCREGRLLPYAEYLIDEIKDDSVGSKTVKSYFASPNAEAPKKSSGKSGTPESKEKTVAGSTIQDNDQRRSRTWSSPSRAGNSSSASKRATESPPKETGESLARMPMPSSRPVTRTVGTDPDFLTSYFQNSRLSFIGSFQQRVTQKQQQRGGNSSSSPTNRRRRPKKESERFVFHVDIDCFFAAVVLRKYPEYRSQPVAIGHGWKTDSHGRPIPVGDGNSLANDGGSNSQGGKKSYSELSTCNYNARKYGVRKGMFLHQARQLCPNLIVLPYDYDGFEEVSSLVSDVLHQHAEKFDGVVEQISCDEAYIEMYLSEDDITKDGNNGKFSIFVKNAAESIRADIFAATECTASIGVGANKFLAKLATDKAKPDGSFVVEDCYQLLHGLKLRDLPGIGWKLDRKLQANQLEAVQDVLNLGEEAKETLCSLLGAGNGQKLMNYIDGKDDRPVEPAKRKTIGAECNYGVRFDGPFGPDYMIDGLSKEVCKRMEAIGIKGGRKLTLKIMQRRVDAAKEPAKFLGHGKCNSLSRTCDINGSCDDWRSISTAAYSLFEGLAIDKDDIRGVGIVLTKLLFVDEEQECAGAAKMTSWLQSGGKKSNNESGRDDSSATSDVMGTSRDDNTDISLVESPPGRTIGSDIRSDEKSPIDSFRRDTTRSIDKSSSKVLPTENRNESLESTEDDGNGEYALPSLSQIDEDILAQMPEDVQDSVRRLRFPNELALADESGGDDQRSGQSNDEGHMQAPLVEHGNQNIIPSAEPAVEDEGGWDLPPLSQIDEDEVMALPTHLRDEILKQLRSKEARKTAASDPSVTATSPHRKKSTSRTNQSHPGDGNLRQLSLKRMMKLASVKSGQDGNSISLSQLDDLPLELQLQIANNDEGPLRYRRQQAKPGARSPPHRKTNGSLSRVTGGPATGNKSSTAQLHLSDNDEDDLDAEPNHFQLTDVDGGGREDDFYHTNILPLTLWMNELSDPSSEDIDHVKQFFATLTKEKRIDDVTSLLRTIKRRGDIWGRNIYGDLLDSIDNYLIPSEGRRLDRSNL